MIQNEDLRKDKTTFGIIDAQGVQNADSAEEKSYDAGKKTSGIKRHIVVDTQGLPHAIIVTTANVTDRQGALSIGWIKHAAFGKIVNVKSITLAK